jgi:hypothetical protein
MDHRGKIVTLSRFVGDKPADYICTSDDGNIVEVVPVAPGSEYISFMPFRLNDCWHVYRCYSDEQKIKEVKTRCEILVQETEHENFLLNAIFGLTADDLEVVRLNLKRLSSLDGDQPVKRNEPTPSIDYRAAKTNFFAQMYGGTTCRPNYVGKLVFVEIPLAFDDDESTEYIVVEQLADSLYVVDTTCCADGVRTYRIPFSDGNGANITILDSYEDDDFIREFIDRLDDMDTDDWDVDACDAAETTSRKLARMLEKKAEQKSSFDDLLKTHTTGLFFGPISSTFGDPKQAEGRCNRTGCSGIGCKV